MKNTTQRTWQIATHGAGLRHSQRGATLIVGLVLLLVLTVLGVSGMNTATMEINMAANMQFQQDAFQMAEDAIDIALGTTNYSTDAPRFVPWQGGDFDRYAVTNYLYAAPPAFGRAFSAGAGGFDAFYFDTQAVGRGPRNASSQHVQSFFVVGKALE